jgi:methylated-DNA-[protein]-cysteine S-methyltransferase
MISLFLETDSGSFCATFNTHGLCGLRFPATGSRGKAERKGATPPEKPVQVWAQLTLNSLNEVLAGRAPKKLPPMDLSAGTPFQQAVWRALAEIPPGQTKSYGEIAQTIGRPKAFRAVGQACGANPIPVLIPCHRALAANGKIGGFSGGLDWKRRLLEEEGVKFR